jgi:DNA-binding protein H-NS
MQALKNLALDDKINTPKLAARCYPGVGREAWRRYSRSLERAADLSEEVAATTRRELDQLATALLTGLRRELELLQENLGAAEAVSKVSLAILLSLVEDDRLRQRGIAQAVFPTYKLSSAEVTWSGVRKGTKELTGEQAHRLRTTLQELARSIHKETKCMDSLV